MLLGGFGFLGRLHGLSIDNLVEVEMVLADGRIVVVNENSYPGKSKNPSLSLILFIHLQIFGGPFEGLEQHWASRLATRPKHTQYQSSSRETSSSL
jgi:hypothetical protein